MLARPLRLHKPQFYGSSINVYISTLFNNPTKHPAPINNRPRQYNRPTEKSNSNPTQTPRPEDSSPAQHLQLHAPNPTLLVSHRAHKAPLQRPQSPGDKHRPRPRPIGGSRPPKSPGREVRAGQSRRAHAHGRAAAYARSLRPGLGNFGRGSSGPSSFFRGRPGPVNMVGPGFFFLNGICNSIPLLLFPRETRGPPRLAPRASRAFRESNTDRTARRWRACVNYCSSGLARGRMFIRRKGQAG